MSLMRLKYMAMAWINRTIDPTHNAIPVFVKCVTLSCDSRSAMIAATDSSHRAELDHWMKARNLSHKRWFPLDGEALFVRSLLFVVTGTTLGDREDVEDGSDKVVIIMLPCPLSCW
eukprot:scaffold5694_cov87-Cylindrotheca_fusiformis.AAC.1